MILFTKIEVKIPNEKEKGEENELTHREVFYENYEAKKRTMRLEIKITLWE